MEAKDLMIGDWVHVEAHRGFNAQNVKVETIPDNDGDNKYGHHYGHIGTWLDGGDNDFRDVETKHLHPIPLTPEILEKNGFIKDADKEDRLADMYHLLVPTGFERESFTIQVGLYREPICGVSTLVKCWGLLPPYNSAMNDIHLCNANYVHQLQHALRLCGIKKEIVL